MKPWQSRTLTFALGGLLIVTVASFFQGRLWWLDLFAHFRWQYILVGFFLIGPCFANRRHLSIIIVILGANLWGISQSGFVIWGNAQNEDRLRPKLSAIFLNTYMNNTHHDQVVSFIDKSGADIVVLSELREGWEDAYRPLFNKYRYHQQIVDPVFGRKKRNSLLMLSHFPLENLDHFIDSKKNHAYLLAADVVLPTGKVTIAGVHLSTSFTAVRASHQNYEVNQIISWARSRPRLAFIMGDFNMTPFAVRYQNLLLQSGLAQSNQNYRATWPSLLVPAGIPIDHVLTGPYARLEKMSVGPYLGSDHRPVLVELSLNTSVSLANQQHSEIAQGLQD